ncbi:thiopeptide-type bacteriocin biosynthesis protein [Chitinophaga sp. RAB17]|uniref:thiopeptide-type bacteriocin biosynthesis protein n=1 Tax=Chitinophaga sp. RAB17 TaxID=3233049 RepID=UPI003F93C832
MKNELQSSWVSYHIYLSNGADNFLKYFYRHCLRYIKKYASSYFFIRYYDRYGFHIRLRYKTTEPQILRDRLIDKLSGLKLDQFTISSIRPRKYTREVARYGGRSRIGLAENYFRLSSDIILALISRERKWSYDLALGTAIKLHYVAIHAIALTGKNQRRLLEGLHTGWLQYILDASKGAWEKQQLLDAFETSFQRQQPIFDKLIVKGADDEVLQRWASGNQNIAAEITKTVRPPVNTSDSKIGDLVVDIFHSYLHMTNNRLGIKNIDECFIFYVLLKYC